MPVLSRKFTSDFTLPELLTMPALNRNTSNEKPPNLIASELLR